MKSFQRSPTMFAPKSKNSSVRKRQSEIELAHKSPLSRRNTPKDGVMTKESLKTCNSFEAQRRQPEKIDISKLKQQ